MENQNNSSGVDTILIVVVLLIIVGFGIWWFTMRGVPMPQGTTTPTVKINLPTGTGTTTPY